MEQRHKYEGMIMGGSFTMVGVARRRVPKDGKVNQICVTLEGVPEGPAERWLLGKGNGSKEDREFAAFMERVEARSEALAEGGER